MGRIQEIFKTMFNPRILKARYSQKLVQDIETEEEQLEKIKEIHNFAHRNAQENSLQFIKRYYFPGMTKSIRDFVKTCEICKVENYERRPQEFLITKTPIPKYAGEIVHIDIFAYNANNLFISSLDKFSKYLKVRPIKSKSIADIKDVLLQLLYDWDLPAEIVMDNESSFVSNVIEQAILNLGIKIFKTPVNRSETNGQVERCHSTIREIARCIKTLKPDITVQSLVQEAVYKYNNSIHSFVNNTPKNIYIGENLENSTFEERAMQRDANDKRIAKLYQQSQTKHDTKETYQDYKPDSYAYEKNKSNNKRESRYHIIRIKENFPTYIIDSNNRKIHKVNLRKGN